MSLSTPASWAPPRRRTPTRGSAAGVGPAQHRHGHRRQRRRRVHRPATFAASWRRCRRRGGGHLRPHLRRLHRCVASAASCRAAGVAAENIAADVVNACVAGTARRTTPRGSADVVGMRSIAVDACVAVAATAPRRARRLVEAQASSGRPGSVVNACVAGTDPAPPPHRGSAAFVGTTNHRPQRIRRGCRTGDERRIVEALAASFRFAFVVDASVADTVTAPRRTRRGAAVIGAQRHRRQRLRRDRRPGAFAVSWRRRPRRTTAPSRSIDRRRPSPALRPRRGRRERRSGTARRPRRLNGHDTPEAVGDLDDGAASVALAGTAFSTGSTWARWKGEGEGGRDAGAARGCLMRVGAARRSPERRVSQRPIARIA
jgi:hypothetical protein